MKGHWRLVVAVKMVSQVNTGKTKFRGKKTKGVREEQGGKGRGGWEVEKDAKFFWPEENRDGFGWELVQPQPCCTHVRGGGGAVSNVKHMSG